MKDNLKILPFLLGVEGKIVSIRRKTLLIKLIIQGKKKSEILPKQVCIMHVSISKKKNK